MPITPPDKPDEYFDPAHPTTRQIYESNKMVYPKSSDEKALELKMDKIRTIEGKYDFKRSVVRLCRYLDEDGLEYVDTEEWISGISSIGNVQEWYSRDHNYSHGEPDVAKIATLQNGEQIIVTGDFVKHVKRVFEIKWEDFKNNKDGIRDKILNNVKDGNKDKLMLRVEGYGLPRSWGGSYKQWWDIWFNYSWDDLILYCQKGVKTNDSSSLEKAINNLSPEERKELIANLSKNVKATAK